MTMPEHDHSPEIHRTCRRCAQRDFSPRLSLQRRSPSIESLPSPLGLGGHFPGDSGDAEDNEENHVHGYLGDAVADGIFGPKTRMSTTKWLAQRHGVDHSGLMCVLPSLCVLPTDEQNWLSRPDIADQKLMLPY